MKSPPTSAISSWAADAAAWSEERRSLPSGLFLFPLGGALLFQRLGRFLLVFLLSIHAFAHDSTPLVNWKKSPAALIVPCPSLDGTLRADLRSSKRAPARLSDISFVSAGKKRGFCQLRSKRMQVQKAKRSELNDQSFLARDGVIRRLSILRSLRSPILSGPAGPRGGFGGFSSTLLMRNSRPATSTFCNSLKTCFGIPSGKSTKP